MLFKDNISKVVSIEGNPKMLRSIIFFSKYDIHRALFLQRNRIKFSIDLQAILTIKDKFYYSFSLTFKKHSQLMLIYFLFQFQIEL
mmetsp:Transcript_1829/g.1277  ORF Transcript_1829/g.1277 Transcript_1829/m.1277 type:complete len:86 (-) Transcript_1829:860-1117(-)